MKYFKKYFMKKEKKIDFFHDFYIIFHKSDIKTF